MSPRGDKYTPVNFVHSNAQNTRLCKTSNRVDKIRRSRSQVRGISPSPPKLGELTAFSRGRHGFGVREAVPPSVSSCVPLCEPLTDRGETIPPGAPRAFWVLLRSLRLCPNFGRTIAFNSMSGAVCNRLQNPLYTCSHIIRKNDEKHNKFQKSMSYKWLNNANSRNGAQRLKIE